MTGKTVNEIPNPHSINWKAEETRSEKSPKGASESSRSFRPRETVFRRPNGPPMSLSPRTYPPDFELSQPFYPPLYDYYAPGNSTYRPPPPPLPHYSDQHVAPMQTYTSSFESNGSGGPYPTTVHSDPHFGGYPFHGGHRYYPPWPGSAPIEYIKDIKPEDVLSGRGGATNSHSGNRAFRKLVKEYQERYLQAKKRDKPAVASIVVEQIRKKGGRFLRRCDTDARGQVLWIDIGDDRAREKTCQALREGAPEIRRRQKVGSSDEEDVKRVNSMKESETTLSSASSFERTLSGDTSKTKSPKARWANEDDPDFEDEKPGDGPIMIRPLSRLLPRRANVDPIPLDQLSAEDRELYLRDFLPPCPGIPKRRKVQDQGSYPDSEDQENRAGTWPIVSV